MVAVLAYGGFGRINCYFSVIMKLLLLFLLFVNLAGLSLAMFRFKRGQLGSTKTSYTLLESKVPESIKNTLALVNKLTLKYKANVEKMETFKGQLSQAKSEISLDKLYKLLKTESKVMQKYYKTLNELEATRNKLYSSLQKTEGTIEYNKKLGKFTYNEYGEATDDMLKPMQTYLPFQSVISLKLSVPIKTRLPPEQTKMINKYDKAMKNIMTTNSKLSMLDYLCNGFVLDDSNLNKLKNEIMSPVIISVSESKKRSIEAQLTLLGEIKQFFIGNKIYKSMGSKLRTEQAKLEGELSVVMKSLEQLKSSESVTDESAQLFTSLIKNENTAKVDTALKKFQGHQANLHKGFSSKNDLGTKIAYLKEEMHKLTESKKSIKKHIQTMISTLLQETDTTDALNYANEKYSALRTTIANYVTLYRQAAQIEHMYKGALEYISRHGSLNDIAIPNIDLFNNKLNQLSSEELATFNRLVPFEFMSVHFNGKIHPGGKAIHKDLNDTNVQGICVSKLCLFATFAVILAIFITIIKAKI